MNTKLTTLVLLLSLFGFGSLAVAGQNEGLSKDEVDQITNICTEESRDAEIPKEYAEECIAERVQAMKEDKGLVKPKEES